VTVAEVMPTSWPLSEKSRAGVEKLRRGTEAQGVERKKRGSTAGGMLSTPFLKQAQILERRNGVQERRSSQQGSVF